MFDYKNVTSKTFLGKFGDFTFEFVMGVVKKVSFNITTNVAHATEIPVESLQGLNITPQNIVTTSIIMGCKIIKNNRFSLI